MKSRITIDVAGAKRGGAARFLRELDQALPRYEGVQVIGRGESLSPSWLLRREGVAKGVRRIALNNASFVGGKQRIVLLRNALHFASPEEMQSLMFRPSPELRAQTPVIRTLTRRATHVIVPCTAMRERVLRYVPSVADRIEVRFHPVSMKGRATGAGGDGIPKILMPIVNSPYKQLELHLAALLAALDQVSAEAQLIVTGQSREYPDLISRDPRVTFVGVLPAADLAGYWKAADAVFFPTKMEAFGYPLAEARAAGLPIIAVDTDQSREIAGGALCGFASGDVDSLARAVEHALHQQIAPDPRPFDPRVYFDRLLGTE